MSQETFSTRITELKLLIEANFMDNYTAAMEYCDTLEQCAYEVDSNELRAYCLCYKGLIKYLNAELDSGYELLLRSVEPLRQTEQWTLLGRVYNALGNIAYYQGEFSLAVDYFFVGIRFCKEHQLMVLAYRIINNIADMYMALGEYRLAAEELLNCAKGFETIGASDDSYAIIYGNLTYCYIHLDEWDKATEYLEKTSKLYGDELIDRCSLLFLQVSYYHGTGDTAKRDETIETLRSLDISSVMYDFLNEIEHHARLLMEIERYDALEELLQAMEHTVTSLFGKEILCTLKLEYYQKIGNKQAYLEQTADYYDITRHLDRQRRQISVHNLINRSSLEKEMDMRAETERDNCILRMRSETDALTGIKNRFKLNEVAEAAFQRAYINGTTLGVELLDIDCYKEYNDNYGHQAGDDCLVSIAKVLQELEANEGVHVGRYGGDEFMILYENYSKEEILAFAQQIKDQLSALNVEHKHSCVSDHVTVSQGIFLKVPVDSNRLWDFTYCADISLYTVKHKGRNDFFLSTSVQEIKDFAGDDSRFAR